MYTLQNKFNLPAVYPKNLATTVFWFGLLPQQQRMSSSLEITLSSEGRIGPCMSRMNCFTWSPMSFLWNKHFPGQEPHSVRSLGAPSEILTRSSNHKYSVADILNQMIKFRNDSSGLLHTGQLIQVPNIVMGHQSPKFQDTVMHKWDFFSHVKIFKVALLWINVQHWNVLQVECLTLVRLSRSMFWLGHDHFANLDPSVFAVTTPIQLFWLQTDS